MKEVLKVKKLVTLKGLERLTHFLGLHHWCPIYHSYLDEEIGPFSIVYSYYCCHCGKERWSPSFMDRA